MNEVTATATSNTAITTTGCVDDRIEPSTYLGLIYLLP